MISKREIDNRVKKSQALCLVKFQTTWSGASQIIEPVYSELADLYSGVVHFYSVDVEEEAGIEAEYGITELPTILFFRSGIIVDHVVGLISKVRLSEKIENALSGNDKKL